MDRLKKFFFRIRLTKYFFVWRYLLFLRSRRSLYMFFRQKLQRDLYFIFVQKLAVEVKVSFLENSMATASSMTKYMVRKLRYRYTLNELIGYLRNIISIQVKGLQVKCSGRFTRRQRASIKKVSFGRISLNTLGYAIDYNYKSVALKYGVGGIKI